MRTTLSCFFHTTTGLRGDLSEQFPGAVDYDGRRGRGQPLRSRGYLGRDQCAFDPRRSRHLMVHRAAIRVRLP